MGYQFFSLVGWLVCSLVVWTIPRCAAICKTGSLHAKDNNDYERKEVLYLTAFYLNTGIFVFFPFYDVLLITFLRRNGV